jgi:hypothetical protein
MNVCCICSEDIDEEDHWSCRTCTCECHWECACKWWDVGIGCPQCRDCMIGSILSTVADGIVELPSTTSERLVILSIIMSLTVVNKPPLQTHAHDQIKENIYHSDSIVLQNNE